MRVRQCESVTIWERESETMWECDNVRVWQCDNMILLWLWRDTFKICDGFTKYKPLMFHINFKWRLFLDFTILFKILFIIIFGSEQTEWKFSISTEIFWVIQRIGCSIPLSRWLIKKVLNNEEKFDDNNTTRNVYISVRRSVLLKERGRIPSLNFRVYCQLRNTQKSIKSSDNSHKSLKHLFTTTGQKSCFSVPVPE